MESSNRIREYIDLDEGPAVGSAADAALLEAATQELESMAPADPVALLQQLGNEFYEQYRNFLKQAAEQN